MSDATNALDAMRREYRRVMSTRMRSPTAPLSFTDAYHGQQRAVVATSGFSSEQAAKMVRLEAAYDLYAEIAHELFGRNERPNADGALTYMGMSIYEVRNLPAPGWRVINAMP